MKLLGKYGSHVFDSTASEMEDVVSAARLFSRMPLDGFVVDVGAGEGAAALGIALLCNRPVLAIELVAARGARISAAAARFGIESVEAVAGDVFDTDLSGAAGLYVNSPFFSKEVPAFIDKLARECRPGTRLFAVNAIVRDLVRDPRLRPLPAEGLRYCTAAFELS
ncbi:MAG: hypothetical protein QOJ94_2477 [Sphingomonadales bacterium]|jgi:precorrin-6B methylase 2|nr:hypothetical protein [Sphingomonadales bacterium]